MQNGYIEEKQSIAQLLGLIDKIDLDESGVRRKLESEIERHKDFTRTLWENRKRNTGQKM